MSRDIGLVCLACCVTLRARPSAGLFLLVAPVGSGAVDVVAADPAVGAEPAPEHPETPGRFATERADSQGAAERRTTSG